MSLRLASTPSPTKLSSWSESSESNDSSTIIEDGEGECNCVRMSTGVFSYYQLFDQSMRLPVYL